MIRPSRLKLMFLRDRLLILFWDNPWGKAVTGIWSATWLEWIAIGCLWLLVWRYGGHPHRFHLHVA